jgi:hypothetical protein
MSRDPWAHRGGAIKPPTPIFDKSGVPHYIRRRGPRRGPWTGEVERGSSEMPVHIAASHDAARVWIQAHDDKGNA